MKQAPTKRSKSGSGLLTAGLTLVAALPAWAGSSDFELMQPTPGPEAAVLTESPRPGSAPWLAGALLQYEAKPAFGDLPAAATRAEPAVSGRSQLRLLASGVLLERLLFSLDLPLVLAESQNVYGGGSFGVNDMRLRLRALAVETENFAFGAMLGAALPTGQQSKFQGSDNRIAQAFGLLLGEATFGDWSARLNFGYEERPRTTLTQFGAVIDDRLDYRAGLGWQMQASINVFVEYAGRLQFNDINSELDDMSEALLGAQIGFGDMLLKPGVGFGLSPGLGVPVVRGLLAFVYAPGHGGQAKAPRPAKEPKPAKAPSSALLVIVKSADGVMLQDAEVRIFKDGKEVERQRTDRDGRLQIALPSATYNVRVSVPAFTMVEVPAIVGGGQTVELPITMSPEASKIPCAPTDNNCKLQWWYDQQSAQPK